MDENIIEHLLDLTELAVETSDLDNENDIEIILALLECCESSNEIPNKKKKREWVKQWRIDRVERGSFPFLENGLSGETSSLLDSMCMKPETFNYILSKIEKDIRKQDTIMRKSISPAEKLAATLQYLATGESYKRTNYKTKISGSFLSRAIPEVCNAIWKHFSDEYLKFPTSKSDWEVIADNFATKMDFPHCLGALESKCIAFQSFRNSIVLLALVDADCRFIYINVEFNGHNHDAEILRQSELSKVIDNAEKYLPADKVIGNGRILPYVMIGDDDFPLQKHFMTPYSHNTNKKRRLMFNIRLARARKVVEQAFGIMSSRFKIIQHKINLSVDKVRLILKTCCVLHNLLSHKSENYLNQPYQVEISIPVSNKAAERNFPQHAAQCIRQGFEEYFMNEGKVYWQELEFNQSTNM